MVFRSGLALDLDSSAYERVLPLSGSYFTSVFAIDVVFESVRELEPTSAVPAAGATSSFESVIVVPAGAVQFEVASEIASMLESSSFSPAIRFLIVISVPFIPTLFRYPKTSSSSPVAFLKSHLKPESAGSLSLILILLLAWLFIDINSVRVYRFYKPGCHYCQISQGEWDKFRSRCMFRMVKCISINMDNASDNEKALADNCDVKTVPTVIKIDTDGKRSKYEGERSADNYMQWVMNNEW